MFVHLFYKTVPEKDLKTLNTAKIKLMANNWDGSDIHCGTANQWSSTWGSQVNFKGVHKSYWKQIYDAAVMEASTDRDAKHQQSHTF